MIQLKELRKKAKLSQEELAERSGVSRITISGLETGAKRNVTTQTLCKLATALNVSVRSFF